MEDGKDRKWDRGRRLDKIGNGTEAGDWTG